MRVPRSDGLLPDRYVEIDLDWFEPDDPASISEFVARTAPLWHGIRGERGVVLNPGFLVDVVTEFGGDVDQRLPLRSRRYERWRDRSYRDLAALASKIRDEARRLGVDGVRVGILIAGVGRVITGSDLYDLASDWCDRHPELYPFDLSPLPGPDLDPRVPLEADEYRYAAYPDGVPAGLTFGELLAAQWAAVSSACGLDVIHLRDGFWGPMLYTRRGPYGVTAGPDPDENATWTTATRDLFAAVKRAVPHATVMAYTSGIGATAEWRSGCIDTEAVLAGGGVDVLIDQTWGGAWQDWWDDWWKGWTNQHTNLLSHAVAVRRAGSHVRHYKLIETWDGWEPFDTVHDVPEKLRWAMWAWSHAAVVTPDGLEVPDGTYISWMNDRHRNLLDADAVEFVAGELDRAETAASTMTSVGGPVIVFDRERVHALHSTQPAEHAGEHVEDAVALMMKWGLPVLAATSVDWAEGALVHDAMGHGAIGQLCATDARPQLVVGRADAVEPRAIADAGSRLSGERRSRGYRRECLASDEGRRRWVHLAGDTAVVADGGTVLAYADGWPTIVHHGDRAWWQPPELADPSNPLLPRSQYGSVASARAAAAWWSTHPAEVVVEPVDDHLPVTVQWWRSGARRTVLVGNLETGWIGDARTSRTVTLHVRHGDRTERLTLEVPPEGCVVHHIDPLTEQEAMV